MPQSNEALLELMNTIWKELEKQQDAKENLCATKTTEEDNYDVFA